MATTKGVVARTRCDASERRRGRSTLREFSSSLEIALGWRFRGRQRAMRIRKQASKMLMIPRPPPPPPPSTSVLDPPPSHEVIHRRHRHFSVLDPYRHRFIVLALFDVLVLDLLAACVLFLENGMTSTFHFIVYFVLVFRSCTEHLEKSPVDLTVRSLN